MTMFVGILLASMLDPIGALGYLLSGLLIRRYWVAIMVSVMWRTLLFVTLGGWSGLAFLLPALVGAVLFTSVVFFVRKAFRQSGAAMPRATRISPLAGRMRIDSDEGGAMFGLSEKSQLQMAYTIVEDCIAQLQFRETQAGVASYMPDAKIIATLVQTVQQHRLSAHDLAVMLVDAGYVYHQDMTDAARTSVVQGLNAGMGELGQAMAQELELQRTQRHDALLTAVYQRALLAGAVIVPQYGSIGASLKPSLGKLTSALA